MLKIGYLWSVVQVVLALEKILFPKGVNFFLERFVLNGARNNTCRVAMSETVLIAFKSPISFLHL